MQLSAQLEGLLVPVKAIAGELDVVEQWPSATSYTAWSRVIERIAGQLKWGEEIELNLQPNAPRLSANHLHPWVWDGARSLWDSGHFADAVLGAAKLVNARLQNKVGRRDISDSRLCAEAFSLTDAKPQGARLRFPGDRGTESWKARQQGALELSKGAFTAIRNPLAHTDNSDMDEQQALELLAVFSVVARWIDECEVQRASQDG
ncbi:TIGR02391 family protein [Glutamicibacter sp. NPDC087344]|uniref:TIGR02391 family protein n=1 Tax=Glutamicibacter sp. NPDC087344 TaxID=3363994 RepID=UPI0038062C6B